MFSCRHYNDFRSQKATIGFLGDGKEILLSVIEPCEMRGPPSRAFDMSRSLLVIIGYLVRDEQKDLESKSYDWMIKIRS